MRVDLLGLSISTVYLLSSFISTLFPTTTMGTRKISKKLRHAQVPASATCKILTLPNEILNEVGLCLPHITSALDVVLELTKELQVQPSFFVRLDSLRALAHTCRRLRELYAPLLWTHIQAALLLVEGGTQPSFGPSQSVWQLMIPYERSRITGLNSHRRLWRLFLRDSFVGTYVR